ncbi:hypothetical protein Q1695_015988 [Nippostrongylus brasiliensis]|nr:hypothetical protein Q1695_015988 [Nippostrongylus brasiliensis]
MDLRVSGSLFGWQIFKKKDFSVTQHTYAFSLRHSSLYILVEGERVVLKALRIQGREVNETISMELNLTQPLPRFIALFATQMQYCPAFISMIDDRFDVWKRGDEIPIKGLADPKSKKRATTTVRDVIIAILAIVAYYYCLTMFILPAYFNIVMPLTTDTSERGVLQPANEDDNTVASKATQEEESRDANKRSSEEGKRAKASGGGNTAVATQGTGGTQRLRATQQDATN